MEKVFGNVHPYVNYIWTPEHELAREAVLSWILEDLTPEDRKQISRETSIERDAIQAECVERVKKVIEEKWKWPYAEVLPIHRPDLFK